MQRDTIEFQKMGVMGYTLLAASGDDGTGHSGFFRCKKFDPNFPATSPYVLAVGGTILTGASETAWISSGGGFSNIFGTPQYQAKATVALAMGYSHVIRSVASMMVLTTLDIYGMRAP